MKKITMSLLVAGSLFASNYTYEVSPVLGYNIAEGNINLENDTVYGIEVQYNKVDTKFKPELSFLYSKPSYEDKYAGAGESKVKRFALNGVYDLEKKGDIQPFVKAGIGYETLSKRLSENKNSAFIDAGAGIKIPFAKQLSFKAEAVYMNKYNHHRFDNNLAVLAGLTFSFGGDTYTNDIVKEDKESTIKEDSKSSEVQNDDKSTKATVALDDDKDGVINSKDKCPSTVSGAKVDENGCEIDSDNDGVVDSLDKCQSTLASVQVDSNGCAVDNDQDGVLNINDKCPNTPKGQEVYQDGCPKLVQLHVVFETDSYNVDQQSMANIEKVADFLIKNGNYIIEIVGYTDSKGNATYNKKLSQNRANSVKQLLIQNGVDESRITAIGKGEENPVATNDTEDGRAKNRRIEAKFIQK